MENINSTTIELSLDERGNLLDRLKSRFNKNVVRHKDIDWAKIQLKLEANNDKLWSLNEMERTGGEPDVVGFDESSDEFIFFDCSAESPSGRRNVCYDRAALDARKNFKPEDSAMDMAFAMGIEMLNEEQYQTLQTLGKFDTKTSNWLYTPPEIRKHGGAIFGDRRFDHVFIYHNGADSYYGARGFRGFIKV
jgi:hypothetical protein